MFIPHPMLFKSVIFAQTNGLVKLPLMDYLHHFRTPFTALKLCTSNSVRGDARPCRVINCSLSDPPLYSTCRLDGTLTKAQAQNWFIKLALEKTHTIGSRPRWPGSIAALPAPLSPVLLTQGYVKWIITPACTLASYASSNVCVCDDWRSPNLDEIQTHTRRYYSAFPTPKQRGRASVVLSKVRSSETCRKIESGIKGKGLCTTLCVGINQSRPSHAEAICAMLFTSAEK